jgi:hypothetical protein
MTALNQKNRRNGSEVYNSHRFLCRNGGRITTMSIPFTWIYLIHDPFTGLYKIGKSDNPEVRLKQLCSPSGGTIAAAPSDYQLVDAWLAPEETEDYLHEMFADARVRGEWFTLLDKECGQLRREMTPWVPMTSDVPAAKIRGSSKPELKPLGMYRDGEDDNF